MLPIYRVPGPYGLGPISGPVYKLLQKIGLFPVTRGPMGTNGDVGAQAAAAATTGPTMTEEDNKKELKLLQEVYGVLSAAGTPYKKKSANKAWVDDVDAYVADRNAFFGSQADYAAYKVVALSELEADGGKLRGVIEPNLNDRPNLPNWREAQVVYYCWVRRAYEKKNIAKGADVRSLILTGTSQRLSTALAKVRADYKKKFKAGGFNPRPTKLSKKYRLGTLSEHATGSAIDIDAKNNAQIEAKQWTAILKFTDKSLNHATRKSKWTSAPKELYDLVVEINKEFMSRLEKAVKEAKAAAAAGSITDPLEAAMAKSEALKSIGIKFLREWGTKGFIAIPWELVKELQEEGFRWGVTFPDPDIHHFEFE